MIESCIFNRDEYNVSNRINNYLISRRFCVVKVAWGVKRTCQNCNSRFYDLQRSPITCPKCGNIYEVLTTAKRSRNRAAQETAKILPFGSEEELLGTDLDLDVDIEESMDDELLEDTSDLDEDLTEMAEVVEVEKEDI